MRAHRLWLPLSFITLGTVGIGWISWLPDLDNNIYHWLLRGIPLLCTVFTLLWFMFLSRWPWSTRLSGLAACLALFGVWKALITVDGAESGTGLPRYVWRWTKAPERTFAPSAEPAGQSVAGAADVPQFLGPDRTGIIADPGLATDWNAQPPRELWRVSVGEGWGSFCVIGGRAITQEQRGEEERVTCYELTTGKELWHHADPVRFKEWQGGDGPRATPTYDAGKLYCIGATGILNCLELKTGKLIWMHDTLKEHSQKNLQWAIAGSPLIVDSQVVVTGGDKPGPTLVSYDKTSGSPLWQAGEIAATYGSPVVATIAGRRLIVAHGATGLMLHDAKTGQLKKFHKWGFEGPPKASQPIMLPGDRIFVSAGYMMGCTMIQVSNEGGELVTKELWSNAKMKTQFNNVTPKDGLLYGLDDGGFACMDATSGKRLWKEGKFGAGQHNLVGDLVLIQSEPGSITLASVNRDGFKTLGALPALSVKTWNYPTLAGRYLLVRNDREAACYELPMKNPPPSMQ